MSTIVATHEVDDVEHWLASPKREELFGPMGITHRTFVQEGTNLVGVVLDVRDVADFDRIMQTEAAAEAMKYDGVRPETLEIFLEP